MTITYRSREDWGGGPVAAGHAVDGSGFVRLAEHHTVIVMPDYDHDSMVAGDVDDFDAYMRVLKVARPDLGPDIPYSYVIGEGENEWDCIVGEGRGNRRTGAHTIGFNSSALGCAWAGDFTLKAPTPGMYEGLRWVGRTMLHDPVNALPTIQHRDVYQTQCPGLSTPSPSLAQPPFTSLWKDRTMTPGYVVTSDGAHHIFAARKDGAIFEDYWVPSNPPVPWNGPTPVMVTPTQQALAAPGDGVAAHADGVRIDLACVGSDGKTMYHGWRLDPSGPWTWEQLAGDYGG